MKKILFAAAILAFGFTSASAQYDSRYDDRDRNNSEYHDRDRDGHRGGRMTDINFLQREARQQIAAGVQRGTLSSREASALMNEYDRIEARERRYSHRGRVSPREARVLREDLERLMANTRRMSDRRGDHWARDRRNRY
jgi:Spy/CpxP family protein refolding chaperone